MPIRSGPNNFLNHKRKQKYCDDWWRLFTQGGPLFFFGPLIIIMFSLPTNNSHEIVQNELYLAKKDLPTFLQN
jgi:hypothetical protein